MTLFLRLAWRNVWRQRRRTIIVMTAIGLGLALMMFYDGLMAGFEQAIYGNAIRLLGGNVQVHAAGYAANGGDAAFKVLGNAQVILAAAAAQPNVVAAAPRINTNGMLSNRTGAFGVGIIGIDPGREAALNPVAQHVRAGRFLKSDDQDVVFMGNGLARAMAVGVGDRITLVGRAPHQQLRSRTMTVAGIYDIGLPDFEKRSIYVSLSEAQSLYDLAGPTEVILNLRQIGQEPAAIAALTQAAPGIQTETWATRFPELQSAVNRKGGVMTVFGVVILIIAGIGILNLLLMAVFERTREIGLLSALGLKPRQISLLFVLEGALMGVLGTLLGIVIGLLINGALRIVGLDFTAYASITEYTALMSGRIYPTWGLEQMAGRAATVIVICVLAALYPAREAARGEPAAALHFV